ncbi:hypothetical protein D3C71_1326830 [compost metagenome]
MSRTEAADYGWIDYDDKKKETKTETETVDPLEEILSALAEGDIFLEEGEEQIRALISSSNNDSWNEGFSAGRSSVDKEIEEKSSFSYDQGYLEGYKRGVNSLSGVNMAAIEEEQMDRAY